MQAISIITVTLNNLTGLIKTYNSLRNSFVIAEWIIIDGSSIDGTKEFVENNIITQYPLVKFISEKDKSLYDAMNKGIKASSGEYLLFLNAGDILLLPLQKLYSQKIVFSDITVFNIKKTFEGKNLKWHGLIKNKQMLKKIPIPHQSTFIKRKLLIELSNYDDQYKYLGDHDFFCKCLYLNKDFIFYPDIVLSEFDMTGISSNPRMALKILKELQQIHKKYFKSNVPKKTTGLYYLKYLFSYIPNAKQNLHKLRSLFFKSH